MVQFPHQSQTAAAANSDSKIRGSHLLLLLPGQDTRSFSFSIGILLPPSPTVYTQKGGLFMIPALLFWKIVLLWLAVVNLAGFVLCWRDKRLAQGQRWRIPERTLLGICALGGGFGFWLGMGLFRHKTRHSAFRFGVPALCLLWLALLAAAIWLSLGHS